jgi:hypothetical protein
MPPTLDAYHHEERETFALHYCPELPPVLDPAYACARLEERDTWPCPPPFASDDGCAPC